MVPEIGFACDSYVTYLPAAHPVSQTDVYDRDI
jgi:hypothetical protein